MTSFAILAYGSMRGRCSDNPWDGSALGVNIGQQ
jgi:hypothetical protein